MHFNSPHWPSAHYVSSHWPSIEEVSQVGGGYIPGLTKSQLLKHYNDLQKRKKLEPLPKHETVRETIDKILGVFKAEVSELPTPIKESVRKKLTAPVIDYTGIISEFKLNFNDQLQRFELLQTAIKELEQKQFLQQLETKLREELLFKHIEQQQALELKAMLDDYEQEQAMYRLDEELLIAILH